MKRNLATIDTDMFTPIGRLIQQANAHGVTNDKIYGGLEAGQTSVQGLYALATIKNCTFGTRRVTWDGKVFRYCYAGGMCSNGQGNKFFVALPATGIDYQVLKADAAEGATTIVVYNNAVIQATNSMAGGSILLKPASGSTNHVLQQRGIISNSSAEIGANCTIVLDGGVSADLTADASLAVAMPSPYSDIRFNDVLSGSKGQSHIGISAVYVAAAGQYHWEQTWGICWIAPQGGTGSTDHARAVVWRNDGSVQTIGITTMAGIAQQPAGYIVDSNVYANGLTKMMLTCDH